jgi:hypothetical protein
MNSGILHFVQDDIKSLFIHALSNLSINEGALLILYNK